MLRTLHPWFSDRPEPISRRNEADATWPPLWRCEIEIRPFLEVVVQFAGMAGIYELPRSDPGFDRFASLIRAAKDSGIPVSFELKGNRIVSVG